jgi:twitching motility protein PilT
MVGELRDFDTIQTAITASETGHLVLGTLHTNTAAKSIDRILDSFPAESKNQVRLQLATSLLAVVSQRLVPHANGESMVAACEILVKSPSVERLILDNKIDEIERIIETSSTYYKMQTMNQSLAELVKAGSVSLDEAIRYCDKPEDLRLKLSGMLGGGQRDVDANDFIEQSKVMEGGEIAEDFFDDGGGVRLELENTRRTKIKKPA